jgi:hypothetical protein
LEANYRNIQNKNKVSFQITGAWEICLFNHQISFNGYADFWREDNVMMNPIMYSRQSHNSGITPVSIFLLGTEIEVSSDFVGYDGFMVNPTIGVKWTF